MMKKKLIKYAIDLACSIDVEHGGFAGIFQYADHGRFFVTDGCRVLETETLIDGLSLNGESRMTANIIKYFNSVNEPELDYHLYNLPTVEEIKEGIRGVCGRKLDTVVWSDGTITMNARWLYKAMEALRATKAYVSQARPKYSPILLCENDDPLSINRVLIMPIYNRDKVGYWLAV